VYAVAALREFRKMYLNHHSILGGRQSGHKSHGSRTMYMLAGKYPVGPVITGNMNDIIFRSTRPLSIDASWDPKPVIDNRRDCPPAENQGTRPWCVIYGFKQLLEAIRWQRTHVLVDDLADPSVWYKEAKKDDGSQGEEGTTIAAAFTSGKRLGYIPALSKMHNIRTLEEYQYAIQDYMLVLSCYSVTEGWNLTGHDGLIHNEGTIVGYHLVVGSGFDLTKGSPNFVNFENQWGDNFGCHGHGRLTVSDWKQYYVGGAAIEIPIE